MRIAADAQRRDELLDLLREEHPVYRDRSAATIARMRGWVLLALERAGVSDRALAFVLEELDIGTDPYLVAAAARALRSYPRPGATLVPFVLRALANIRYRDEPLSFAAYGALCRVGHRHQRRARASGDAGLARAARAKAPSRSSRPCSGRAGFRPSSGAMSGGRCRPSVTPDMAPTTTGTVSCCGAQAPLADVLRQRRGDRLGRCWRITQATGSASRRSSAASPRSSAFFYTRCDNPLKCSLTVAKLARVQQRLAAERVADRIRTAAITYDPAFDLAPRLRAYGQDRGVRMDAGHRLFRAVSGNDAVRDHFGLGVNYVGSLVNRHRIELHILDAQARIAASFERLRWDEREVVAKAVEVLKIGGR